jgi:hypothetical protein
MLEPLDVGTSEIGIERLFARPQRGRSEYRPVVIVVVVFVGTMLGLPMRQQRENEDCSEESEEQILLGHCRK